MRTGHPPSSLFTSLSLLDYVGRSEEGQEEMDPTESRVCECRAVHRGLTNPAFTKQTKQVARTAFNPSLTRCHGRDKPHG